MASWPEEVPILEAEDFCRDTVDDREGHHCLMGWLVLTFGGFAGPQSPQGQALSALLKQCERITGRLEFSLANFNDKKNRRLDTLANVWNRAMKSLGYDTPVVRKRRSKSKERAA